jgi:hypothetical protein
MMIEVSERVIVGLWGWVMPVAVAFNEWVWAWWLL